MGGPAQGQDGVPIVCIDWQLPRSPVSAALGPMKVLSIPHVPAAQGPMKVPSTPRILLSTHG